MLGHDYIGIDISKEYTKYANDRINNCEYERPEVNQEIELHKVKKTFADRKREGSFVGRHRKQVTEIGDLFEFIDTDKKQVKY